MTLYKHASVLPNQFLSKEGEKQFSQNVEFYLISALSGIFFHGIPCLSKSLAKDWIENKDCRMAFI